MKQIVLFIFMMLPVAVMGQTQDPFLEKLPVGTIHAIGSILNKTPQKDSVLYIVSKGDTVWQKNDPGKFFYLVSYQAMTENVVKSICGVAFGSSYEETKDKLRNKCGRPVYSTQNELLYNNISYGGEYFDDLLIKFQHNNVRSYLCQAIFVKNARDWENAKEIKKSLCNRLSRHYSSIYNIDEELSVGGLPPAEFLKVPQIENPSTTSEMGFGFEIKILKQDKYDYPYFVRIMYGPYEYVKEDF